MERGPLFHGRSLRRLTEVLAGQLDNEIVEYNLEYILDNDEGKLCQDLVDKYSLTPPRLRENDIYRTGYTSSPGRSKGISVTIVVPFDGDGDLFCFQPSKYYPNPPYGKVVGQELCIAYENIDPARLEETYTRNLDLIKEYLQHVKADVRPFNESLPRSVEQKLAKRKSRLLADQEHIDALGIPVKRRNDTPRAYEVPITTKRPNIVEPQPATKPLGSEPFLHQDDYENILEIICSMSLAMERSPRVFSKLQEEEMRDFFLVFLNGHYGWEAQVAGEVFNFTGKTDILINYKGRNVFIAECKFWTGERGLQETMDQLFGYTTWRDTKTAILLFSKRASFTSVKDKIDGVMKSHEYYRSEHRLESTNLLKIADPANPEDRTVFGYKFCQPNDENREVFLTVMAFNIPNV